MNNDLKKVPSIDFSSVIAVAVHDMKNSLSLLIQSIEQLSKSIPDTLTHAQSHVSDVHYEATRINTGLVQILSLYRAEIERLPTCIDECFVEDLVEELATGNATYMKQKSITVTTQVDPDLSWYLDKDLIFLLMNDVVVNAVRYGCSKILIKAIVEDDLLVISVEDDGPGYPDDILQLSHVELDNLSINEGRTGLGLFFAKLIAQTHINKDIQGEVELKNNSTTGGSIFRVKLP